LHPSKASQERDRYFDRDEFPGIDLQANSFKTWFAECGKLAAGSTRYLQK
jgi:hypothetical protein